MSDSIIVSFTKLVSPSHYVESH